MTETWTLILGLAAGTFSIRLGGYLLGSSLPATGLWARVFTALPGCLIAALLAVILVQGSGADWGAAAVSLVIAMFTRNLPLTMIGGIVTVWLLRGGL